MCFFSEKTTHIFLKKNGGLEGHGGWKAVRDLYIYIYSKKGWKKKTKYDCFSKNKGTWELRKSLKIDPCSYS